MKKFIIGLLCLAVSIVCFNLCSCGREQNKLIEVGFEANEENGIARPFESGFETKIRVDTKKESEHCLKYIKSKFARCLLGVLKVTQATTPEKWKYVPLQDFTENSDIDWTKSVAEIDKQLYAKYGLTEEEIFFIETNVKEMK